MCSHAYYFCANIGRQKITGLFNNNKEIKLKLTENMCTLPRMKKYYTIVATTLKSYQSFYNKTYNFLKSSIDLESYTDISLQGTSNTILSRQDNEIMT